MTTTPDKTTITPAEVKKVAHLARLQVDEQDIPKHVKNLSNILELIAHIDAKDVSQVTPMSSSLEGASLALRPDQVVETDQRAILQKLAPMVDSGLYLVPQVIE